MRRTHIALLTALMLTAFLYSAHSQEKDMGASNAARRIRPRKDCFFGLHFDLHPGKTDTSLGADIAEENIAALLDRVRPDFVQYDCKGHAGYTGYPTKVGWPSPGIVKDSLAVWRRLTRERGVGLYIHYSGVWDTVAIEHHPEWARLGPNGERDPNYTSVFSPYVDQLMIPQLREVATEYDLDGVWADGECWAAQLDWSPAAIAAWKQETGYTDVPKKRGDPHWLEWKNFHRRHFERYLRHWVDSLHKTHPKLNLTSNWMYTTFAPKPIEAKLDYLSGDYSPSLSVDRARVEARYLAHTGMPWDLMAWGFNWVGGQGHCLKPALQLQQEAAVVLMQGGGFQVYYQPTRSGYIVPEIIQTMGEVGDFVRARQKVSHKSVSVPQVALLLSAETQFDRSDAVFTPYGCMDELEGALHALLELHYSVDILAEWQLQPRLQQFPLVVIPDSYKLSSDFKAALLKYVEGGGSLLLLGQQCARLFESSLGVKMEGSPQEMEAELATGIGVVNANGVWQRVTPTTAQVIGYRYPSRDTRRGGEPAATLVTYGKGKIAAVYGPVALNYFRAHHSSLRRFIGDIVHKLFPDPAVQIAGPPCLDVALRRAPDGKLSLHLLNVANMQRFDRGLTTDYIPAVGPIEVRMRLSEKPKRVRRVPDGGRLKWTWKEGALSLTLPSVHIHTVLVVE
jgi:hypothetical protein